MRKLLCLSLTILTTLTFSLTSYSEIGAATADTPTTAAAKVEKTVKKQSQNLKTYL